MLSSTNLSVGITRALQSFQEDATIIELQLKALGENVDFSLPKLHIGTLAIFENGATTTIHTLTLDLPTCFQTKNITVHGFDVEKINMFHIQMNTIASAYFEKKKLAKKPPMQEFGK